MQKLAAAEIMVYPIVLIKKNPDFPVFGPEVQVTCRQYMRSERERPFGFEVRCESPACQADDQGHHLRYHQETSANKVPHPDRPNQMVPVPKFRIECVRCAKRTTLDLPQGVTQLRSNIYVADYPTVPTLIWREKEANMHDHSLSTPAISGETSASKIATGSRKRDRAPSAVDIASLSKKKSRESVGK